MNTSSRIDVNQVDGIFRLLCRETWIVTAAHDGQRGGLVATWVSPASIDREHPVVLIGIAPNHFTAELIDGSHAFALHLLRKDQVDVAWNFAIGSGRERDKFTSLPFSCRETSSPLLDECLAWLDCRVFSRLATGDRNYYWADVVASQRGNTTEALTDRDLIQAATDEQKQLLLANRDDDVALQRPLLEAWRKALPPLLHP